MDVFYISFQTLPRIYIMEWWMYNWFAYCYCYRE